MIIYKTYFDSAPIYSVRSAKCKICALNSRHRFEKIDLVSSHALLREAFIIHKVVCSLHRTCTYRGNVNHMLFTCQGLTSFVWLFVIYIILS
ncbi:hypothetical protein ACROYT_G004994 [Oculina patagonica]